MHVPYVLTNLGKLKLLTAYTVAYIHSLIYNIASRATHFVVSVPAQEFHFSPTTQLYMQNVNLGSRLQAKYYHIHIPVYIYFRIYMRHIYTSVSKLTLPIDRTLTSCGHTTMMMMGILPWA